MRSYQQVRRILSEATQELSNLDSCPDVEAAKGRVKRKSSAEAVC
jgi:hypothetical protein